VRSIDDTSTKKAIFIATFMDQDGIVSAEIERLRIAAEKLKDVQANSVYVGDVGVRETFELTLRKRLNFQGYYGTVWLHLLSDADGNTFKYMGSARLDIEEGNTASITATIKKHEEYKDEKQTVINRPKVLENS